MSGWRGLLAVVPTVLALAAPALVRGTAGTVDAPVRLADWGDRPGVQLDRSLVESLKALAPDFVFVGNSMLESRISSERLNELLRPRVALVNAERNTRMIHWYLWLKNVLIPAGQMPERVFVFFQGRDLTNMNLTRFELIDRLAGPHEPELAQVASAGCSDWRDEVESWLVLAYPAAGGRSEGLRYLRSWLAPSVLFGSDGEYAFHEELNLHFDLTRLRGSALSGGSDGLAHQAAGERFERRVLCTLLQPTVELARRHGVPLSFVRVQDRPLPTGQLRPQTAEERAYFSALRRFIEERGFEYIDFSGTAEVGLDWYGQGHHIADTHTARWTDLFHRRVFLGR